MRPTYDDKNSYAFYTAFRADHVLTGAGKTLKNICRMTFSLRGARMKSGFSEAGAVKNRRPEDLAWI
jgi:hypothetical protein